MVVAYGTAKRSAFTGSAAMIDNEKIGQRQTSNVTNALAGQVAGRQWEDLDSVISGIRRYQHREAAAVLPSDARFKAELCYNRMLCTGPLAWTCLSVGLLAFVLNCRRMALGIPLSHRHTAALLFPLAGVLAWLCILLALRGYVSGHWPLSNGYETMQAQTGEEAQSMISSHCPDLIILDLGLPDMDGLEILRSLRTWTSLPVVVVSARSHERDKVAALDMGADDYLTKPFGTDELLARVRTAIRHTRTASGNDEIARNGTYTVGELVIDYNKHQVRVRGENVHLTLSEFRIVALLGKYAGKVLTYDFIIKELWGPRASGDNQILRVNMANIRRKIEKNPAEPEYLFTEMGVGYRMAEGG